MERASLAARAFRLLVLAILFAGSIVFLLPVYVTVTMSLKSPAELATTSMWSWPRHVTWENYHTVITNQNVNFALLLRNTSIVTTVNTLGTLFGCSVVAYAFARLKFAGRDRLFLILLGTMMLPGLVTMIPTYVLFAKLHWVNTFYPLTVPSFFGGGAFNIFLMRQFYLSIPRELDEAAVLDGASHWTIFSRLILPSSGPALATIALLTFVGTWKDLIGPLLYLNDADKQTLEVGLNTYHSLNGDKWHLLMAGTMLISIPIILIFLLGQRYFIKGIVMTGFK